MLLNGCYIHGAKIALSVSSIVERTKAVVNVVRWLLPKPKPKTAKWVSVLPSYRLSDEDPRKILYRRQRLDSGNRHQQTQPRFASDSGGENIPPLSRKYLVTNHEDVLHNEFSREVSGPSRKFDPITPKQQGLRRRSICGGSIVSDRPLPYGNNGIGRGCGMARPYSMDVFSGKAGRL